jgi:hypothetical protein
MPRHEAKLPQAKLVSVFDKADTRKSPVQVPARAQIASFNFANKLI